MTEHVDQTEQPSAPIGQPAPPIDPAVQAVIDHYLNIAPHLPVRLGVPPPHVTGPENAEITRYYEQRRETGVLSRYSLFRPGSLFRMQSFERDMLATLFRHGRTQMSTYQMLDIGCGNGAFLRRLVSWGADPRNLAGIELVSERVAAGRRYDPSLDIREGDARKLPFESASFDIVFQNTVFSSIIDRRTRRQIADEMERVLRPGGLVVSYDFRVARDRRHTRPLRVAELITLFPGFAADARRVTLVPPLARALAGHSWVLCTLLELIPPLRTHDLVVLTKP